MILRFILALLLQSVLIQGLPALRRSKRGQCVDPLGGVRRTGEEWIHDRKFYRRCLETKNGWRIETIACILPDGEKILIGEVRAGASCERDENGITRLSLPFRMNCGKREHGSQWDEDDFKKECQYGSIRLVGCYSRHRQLILPNQSVTENNVTYKCVRTNRGLVITTDSAMPTA